MHSISRVFTFLKTSDLSDDMASRKCLISDGVSLYDSVNTISVHRYMHRDFSLHIDRFTDQK